MRNTLFLGAAIVALAIPAAASAQSTGSVDAEEVVVTGSRNDSVGGVKTVDTTRNKAVLTQQFISRQTPGQSVNEIINNLPGVSFQNNDPFGSAGGTLTIRGFDSTRISQTFDGIPLNDTGNYAIYSNQQLDPELIEQVNVNLGTTDVDSPTAAATGSTVNYRSLMPSDTFGARMVGSVGDYSFFRVFGLVNTGVFTPWGTKAWIAGSSATNDVVFNNYGKIAKQQYNAKIYQPIGSNGDFIAISGHYNQNRNNFFGSAPLRNDTNVFTSTGGTGPNAAAPTLVTGAVRTAGTGSSNRFPNSRDELPYNVARCQIDTPSAGTVDVPNSCGTSFDERYNPSNTSNIRINSRFTLADNLVLSADPYYQYTKANGGGTVRGQEGAFTARNGQTFYGFIGNNYYFGRDLNGDGDLLDRTTTIGNTTTNGGVTLLAPSQTVTHRYGVISSLRYDFAPGQTFRVAYTHEYARHRQTGELGYLQLNGKPFDVFPINNPILAANGFAVQKRDRLSFAILDQVSGEYTGKFFDDTLTLQAGVRAPWFKRDLNNFCFVTSGGGNVDCLGRGNDAANAAYAAANPYSYNAATNTVTGYAVPQQRVLRYNRVLPSAGFTYRLDSRASVFGNYSRGFQVPGTDNLYQTLYYPAAADAANPKPEFSDNFDLGARYTTNRIQAQVGLWYTKFSNRLASAYDVDTQQTIYRNLGRVDKYGIDGSIAYRPIDEVLLYVFGSYMKSEIKNDVVLGRCPTTLTAANTTTNCSGPGAPVYALTAGKRESGAPVYTFGGRAQATLGPVDLGVQAKRTGRRYLNDQNLPQFACTVALINNVCPTVNNVPASFSGTRGIQYQTYGAYAPGYTTVDLDARIALGWTGIGTNKTYIQVNLQNVFNTFYVGGLGQAGQTANVVSSLPFVQIGSPRALIVSLNTQF
ncbi:TonB-dependent receptor [Sphingomonas sanguinis]|uniref:TonB-dependent receptor n=1 Tax=Sphingomonas sanguinis TaxID=33051 RepID=A0A147J7Z4_9SPHN|nr:TonB-dependent receptor [Sphingomonas sanguinis]KTW12109.1 TonB-dependent receptor [Sphingomonas sanguinis]